MSETNKMNPLVATAAHRRFGHLAITLGVRCGGAEGRRTDGFGTHPTTD